MIRRQAPLTAFEFSDPAAADFANPIEVFNALVGQMPDRLDILNTENYFYFACQDSTGVNWNGGFGFRIGHLESGLAFRYERAGAPARYSYLRIDGRHGLTLCAESHFHYRLGWRGRNVDLCLNRLPLRPPKRAALRDGEKYVGPCYDESGLQFSLLFDARANCFLWILNDDEPVPETFSPIGSALALGARTRYVFLGDPANQRRVLIGVAEAEIEANSYCDGPFDQLPDNHIAAGEVELRRYLELQNPDRQGQIDEFGFFKMMKDCRVAVTPYHEYKSPGELSEVTAAGLYGGLLKKLNAF